MLASLIIFVSVEKIGSSLGAMAENIQQSHVNVEKVNNNTTSGEHSPDVKTNGHVQNGTIPVQQEKKIPKVTKVSLLKILHAFKYACCGLRTINFYIIEQF